MFLDDLPELLGCNGKEVQAETWITLPRSRRPRSWDNIEDPVCRLKRNLYGHPIAGLIWEKFCHKQLKSVGFQPIPGWESLFVHKARKLFLSVYVDDFRMAGPTEAVRQMWKELKKVLDLDARGPSPVFW